MKIYLCSQYERRDEMLNYAADLEGDGHEIVSKWITGIYEAPSMTRDETASYDAIDLESAECLLFFSERPNNSNGRGGRWVEFGMAYAWRKRIITVGPLEENVFHSLPGLERYVTFDEGRKILRYALPQEKRLEQD